MERTFKVTVFLNNVTAEGDDEDSLKDAVKEALHHALVNDDIGEEDLEFNAEEVEQD